MVVCFNPHAPYGLRRSAIHVSSISILVSIHTPRTGCDIKGRRAKNFSPLFQSTHPVRVATPATRAFFIARLCFNPRTPTGCDTILIFTFFLFRVSIHAPLRGATCHHTFLFNLLNVSIHAPLRGATQRVKPNPTIGKFQSTHPYGVRRQLERNYGSHPRFNPRTPTGCDDY